MAEPYPSGGDYMEALQNPKVCFQDDALRRMVPERGRWGPRVISGNFASVFPVTGPDGRRYAIKCFTRPAPNQMHRYQVISAKLARNRPQWAVRAFFHDEAILVRGRRYPVLRMDWVDAHPLTRWIDRTIATRGVLDGIAERFAVVARDLVHHEMAHGDLQHGNVLVDSDGQVHLVDYDGVYLPALGQYRSDEVGHPNYQHPDRDQRHYGPDMDRYAACLIYFSLRALEADPGLWSESDREEYLLLQRPDLANPADSALVARLGRHRESAVRDLAEWVRRTRPLRPSELPTFDEAVGPDTGGGPRRSWTTVRPAPPNAPSRGSSHGRYPEWLRSRLAAGPGGSGALPAGSGPPSTSGAASSGGSAASGKAGSPGKPGGSPTGGSSSGARTGGSSGKSGSLPVGGPSAGGAGGHRAKPRDLSPTPPYGTPSAWTRGDSEDERLVETYRSRWFTWTRAVEIFLLGSALLAVLTGLLVIAVSVVQAG